ncbi:MAG: hypothetical protein KMY53_13380 [Desulfarculus sp.]|nr:hypothetical protein [Pseudomonadota bacterium]MBV1715800.1 hypothetical protein [Desulfarculus sp.]MBU4573874.1 hypothetical protein [Pseudomonadota bacterium]MBU4597337.1 hypothetical protein [Pseudomonadota bacterium]MBV1739155.1 hypothetical protein [Desulfarculus sp.]
MPVIELNLSEEVYRRWREFLGSQQGDRLVEAGLLGDWVALGFMNKVNDYLKLGGPPGVETEEERRQRLEAEARRKLTKLQKRVLPMFDENETVTLPEVCRVLGILSEDGQTLTQEWLDQDFLSHASKPRDDSPTFVLSRSWQERNLAANRPSLHAPRRLHFAAKSKPGPNEG